MTNSVSVVIPTYNGASWIADQLRAIQSQTMGPDEVLIADNGSTDSTVQLAEEWAGRLPMKVVDASERRGNAAARNLGAAHANGDVLLFLDQDDIADPRWIESMVEGLRESELVAGRNLLFMRSPSEVTDERRDASWQFSDSTYGFLPYGLSCNMGVRRSTFDELGGFDERYVAATDVDLCWRAQVTHHSFGLIEGAVVVKRSKSRGAFRQHREFGVDDVLLFERFRDKGMPASRPLGRWMFLVTRLPLLPLSEGRRRGWMRTAGRSVGRVVGSWRYRIVYL